MKKSKEKQLIIKSEKKPLKEAPFTVLPKAVFHLRRNHNTKRSSLFRLLLTTCYFYSKAMTEDFEARVTYSELMKILNCKSMNTITTILTLLENNLIIVDKGYNPHKKQSTIILSHPTVIAERVQNAVGVKVRENVIFKFPKILLLLPISPQAKTILLYLYSKKNYPEDWEVPVTGKEIMKQLKLKKETVFKALKELYDKNLITEVGKQNKLTIIRIIPPISVDKENKPSWRWDKKLVHSAFVDFPTHPFWKLYIDNQLINPEEIITTCLNTETKPNQYGTDKRDDLTNMEPILHQYGTHQNLTNRELTAHQYGTDKRDDLTNMEPILHQYGTHQKEQEQLSHTPQDSLEDYIEEAIVEDYIDDAIYNGGVSSKEELNPSIKKEIFNFNKEGRKAEDGNLDKKQDPKKELPLNKVKEVKKVSRKPSKLYEQISDNVEDLSGRKIFGEREKIEKIVECIEKKIPEYIFSRFTIQEDWLTALKKFYSDRTARFLILVYMYLSKNTTSYTNIRNPVGFLISFADKDRAPDFKEFLQRFFINVGDIYTYKTCVERFYDNRNKQLSGEFIKSDCLKKTTAEKEKLVDTEENLDVFTQTLVSESLISKKLQVEEIEKSNDVEKVETNYKAVVLDGAELASLYFKERRTNQEGGVRAFSNLLEQESIRSGECSKKVRSYLGGNFDGKLLYYVLPENVVRDLEKLYERYWKKVVIGVVNFKPSQESVFEF